MAKNTLKKTKRDVLVAMADAVEKTHVMLTPMIVSLRVEARVAEDCGKCDESVCRVRWQYAQAADEAACAIEADLSRLISTIKAHARSLRRVRVMGTPSRSARRRA